MTQWNMDPVYVERRQRFAEWLPTLTKGRRFLRLNDCFCVEGAMCEFYRQQTGDGEWRSDDSFRVGGWIAYAIVPDAVLDWFGFGSSRSLGDAWTDEYSFAGINDNTCWNLSFSDFALAIHFQHAIQEEP